MIIQLKVHIGYNDFEVRTGPVEQGEWCRVICEYKAMCGILLSLSQLVPLAWLFLISSPIEQLEILVRYVVEIIQSTITQVKIFQRLSTRFDAGRGSDEFTYSQPTHCTDDCPTCPDHLSDINPPLSYISLCLTLSRCQFTSPCRTAVQGRNDVTVGSQGRLVHI